LSWLGDEPRGLVAVPLLPNTGGQVANGVVLTTQSASRADPAQKLLVGQTWRPLTAEYLLTVGCSLASGEQGLGDIVQ